MSVIEILLRGFVAGAMLAVAIGLLRGGHRSAGRLAGAMFCASVAAFAVHSKGAETEALGVLWPLVFLLSAGAIGWFWLFVVALFRDRRFRPSWLAPPLLLIALALLASAIQRPQADGAWVVHNVAEIALVTHALFVGWRSSRGDLVETRRTFRAPFLALVGLFAVLLSGVEIADAAGLDVSGASLAQAAALAALAMVGAAVLLQPHRGLFEREVRPVSIADGKEAAALQKLESLVASEVWRREGLTIGALAAEVGVPEHRLRRLINVRLGHRNFADFLNTQRIAAAKAALADPRLAETSVSAIAFELGYASLAPFHRAFREQVGQSPTSWRAQALATAAKT